MNFHLCKTRRGSNPDAVVNCNNSGTGGVSPGSQTDLDHSTACSGPLTIQICPTTGGLFTMDIASTETVEGLKRLVAKKLGVAQEKISLLYRDRLLKGGSLRDNQLGVGSRVTLLPHVEAGLVSPHPEVSVTQALESLSESQVNDFLAGKSPLTLAMKLGKHMMFLQLQLSTVVPGPRRGHVNKPTVSRGRPAPQQTPNTLTVPLPHTAAAMGTNRNGCQGRMARVPSPSHPASIMTPPPSPKSPSQTTHSPYSYPVMSCPAMTSNATPMMSLKDVDYEAANTPPPSPCYIHKPIPTVPPISSNVDSKRDNGLRNTEAIGTTFASGSGQGDSATAPRVPVLGNTEARTTPFASGSGQGDSAAAPRVPLLGNTTLAAAKRSLSMTLEEFSKKAATERAAEMNQKGAVIDTMQRLGHGVYSGTFSGTLNPALQDTEGKPRKNISTIVHILNDLLGATHPRPGSVSLGRTPARATHREESGARYPGQGSNARQLEEDQTIRGKVEHIQMKLEEGRRRRQARRNARTMPYSRTHQNHGHPKFQDQLPQAMDTTCRESDGDESEDYARRIPEIRKFAPV